MISSEAINLGDSVTINAKAAGGSGKYTYGVYYRKSTSQKWSTAQSYKANSTVKITPAAGVDYDICVKVTDSYGTITTKYFTVKVSIPSLINKSTISANTIKKGESVTITAKAIGGQGKYTYAIYYKKSTSEKWTTVQSFSTKSTAMITPAAAIKYNICVKVKDSSGKIVDKNFDITCTN